jgi:hypothetical protein
MSWSGLTLVTDAEIGQYEPEATNGHWKSTTWPNQRANAKIELKTWLETDYSQSIGVDVADKIRDTYASDKVWGYVGGGYSDVTDAASDDTEDDVDLSAVFVTFGTDRLYIGNTGTFDGLDVRMLATLNAIASVLTVKYSGPSGWTSLTATDGTTTSGKTFAQSGRITWTQPSDWQRRTLNNSADSFYWIELSVSAALTSGTSLGQLLIIKPPDGLKRVALLLALGYIVQTLAAQAPSVDYWMFKARNQFKTGFLDQAERKYAEMRDKGGIPIDIDNDGTIDPGETHVISPVRIGRA